MNINGNQVLSIYYSVTKVDDSFNTLIITLKNPKTVVYEYLEIKFSKDNSIGTLSTIVIIIIIVLILLLFGEIYIIKYIKRKNDPNQLVYQIGIAPTNMNSNNNLMIPMDNQSTNNMNNQYNK